MTVTRLAEREKDAEAIATALKKLEAYAKSYDWAISVDYEYAKDNILNCVDEQDAFVIDGYLVMTEVIVPWYSKTSLLQEWLVIKIYPGGDIDAVPPELLAIARDTGCSAVITADSSPVSIVANAYRGAGFKPLTTSFFKVVT
jgi:hypothetical protein